MLAAARLPEASYHQPVVLLDLGRRLFLPDGNLLGSVVRVVPSWLFLALLLRYRREGMAAWRRDAAQPYLLIFIGAVTIILAWAFSTYDYNLYFDHAHLADRLVLLGLGAAVLWRPVFVWAFVPLAVAMMWQFSYPIGHFSVAQPFVLVRMLLIFGGAWALRAMTKRSWSAECVFLCVTVLASAYLRCGWGKLALDADASGWFNWLNHGHIYFLLFATHANGWLGHLDSETIASIALRVSKLDPLMVAGTILLECGAVFALLQRRILMGFLAGWIAFHLCVFGLSGIFFWKWILVEAALLSMFFARGSRRAFPIFTRGFVWLSIPLIIGGMWWYRPTNLAWFDSPLSYTYRFIGTGESGAQYPLPPVVFAPYDYQFTLGNFHYLADASGLDVTWGAIWNRNVVDRLLTPVSLPEVEALEATHGRNRYDPRGAERLDAFLDTFLSNYYRRQSKTTPLSVVAAPHHLWSVSPPGAYRAEEPLREVEIHQSTGYFDGESFRELRDRIIRRVPISRN